MPILSFSNIAYAELTIYDFSDEAQAQFDAEINKTETLKEETPKLEKTKTNKKQQAQPTQKQEIKTTTQNINTINDDYIVIKNGESLYATLQSSISSASIDKNDTIAAILEQDWKYKGKLIAPKGSILYGNATEAKRAGIFLRDGSMGIEFNQLMTPDGSRILLSSNKVTLNAHGEKKLNAVRNIACGAVMGVVSGLFYTLISGSSCAQICFKNFFCAGSFDWLDADESTTNITAAGWKSSTLMFFKPDQISFITMQVHRIKNPRVINFLLFIYISFLSFYIISYY